MGVGVFGKLPARRDYVQHGAEPRLMQQIDPWLQQAVAESRDALGRDWLDIYLRAPIWRFWLGAGIAGRTVLGALMPSVDGVGRYFPLCVLGSYDAVPPPEFDEQEAWFGEVETLMLAALSEGGTYEALLAGVAELPPPRPAQVLPDGGAGLRALFAGLRVARMDEFYDRYSYWWVPSPDGGATPPRTLVSRGLPAPAEYAMMIAPDRAATPAPAAPEAAPGAALGPALREA